MNKKTDSHFFFIRNPTKKFFFLLSLFILFFFLVERKKNQNQIKSRLCACVSVFFFDICGTSPFVVFFFRLLFSGLWCVVTAFCCFRRFWTLSPSPLPQPKKKKISPHCLCIFIFFFVVVLFVFFFFGRVETSKVDIGFL